MTNEKRPALESQSQQTPDALGTRLKRPVVIVGLIIAAIVLLAGTFFAMGQARERRLARENAPKEQMKPVDAKRAQQDAQRQFAQASKKKKQPQMPKAGPVMPKKVTLLPTTQPTSQPMVQPAASKSVNRPPNPWRTSSQQYQQRMAQLHFQLKAQARTSNMEIFNEQPSSTTTQGGGTQEEQAFLAKIQAKRQGSQPSTHAFGQPVSNQLAAVRHTTGGPKLLAGTRIDAVLETGVDSQLPGVIFARVASPVYDPTMTKIMIPSGTRLVGTYNPKTKTAQDRVQVSFKRMILNQRVIELPDFYGVDLDGASGVNASVNNHWQHIATGAIISSVFGATGAVFGGPTGAFQVDPRQSAVYGALSPFEQTGQRIAKRYLDVEPTLTIKAGRRIGIMVTQSIELQGVRR